MKKLILLITLSLAIFNMKAQSGWEWQNPLPQGNPLNCIHFNAHSGWAVGENGTALHMKDYGEIWELIDLGTDENLNGVYMFDDLMAFIVGDNGLILRVIENRETNTYDVKKLDSPTDKDLFSVSWNMNNCPFVLGDAGTLLKSDDFGETWEMQQLAFESDLNEHSNIECSEICVVGRNGSVFYTYDSGISWHERSVPTTLSLLAVDMGTFENIRVAGQNGNIWHTEDKGLTWHKEYEKTGYPLLDIINIGLNVAYAVGRDYKILETIDYGETWTEPGLNVPNPNGSLRSVTDRRGENSVWAVGHYGVILKNSGIETEFELQTQGEMKWIHSVKFINDSVGWVAGGNSTGGNGFILGTTDGGESWKLQKHTPALLGSIDFINENEGWAVGRNGIVVRTRNGGKIWRTLEPPINDLLSGVSFVDEDNGWVVTGGGWGHIFHTKDGGDTWTEQINPSLYKLGDVFFLDENNGWAVGMDTTIIRTTDGGQNWLMGPTFTRRGGRYGDVFFIDEMKGWVVGTDGRIVLTEDGGITWQDIESGVTENLQTVYFIDQNNGWTAGDQGTVLRTVDGGHHWFKQRSGVSNNYLTSISFINASKGWIVGEGGTIIHTSNGGFSHEYGTFRAELNGLPIYDNQETSSTIEVVISDYIKDKSNYIKDKYYITGLEIFFDSIMHPSVSDLVIKLTHNGVTETLVHNVSNPGENFLWTKLTDEATLLINEGIAPFSGAYKPHSPLSAFNGMDPNGEWTLSILDNKEGHEGTLFSWGIKPIFEKKVSVNQPIFTEGEPKIEFLDNIPNPFSGRNLIKWKCNEAGHTSLKITNLNGQELVQLVDKYLPEGEYDYDFDGSFLNPGIYLCKFTFSGDIVVKKIIKF